MMVLLPLAVFAAVFLLLFAAHREREQDRMEIFAESFLAAAILWGSFVAVSTESLSFLKSLNRIGIGIVWVLVLALLAVYGVKSGLLAAGWQGLVKEWRQERRFSWLEKLSAAALALFAVMTLVVAWVAPPNTNDALAYHMSRVMHWIQNQSLAHYPTPIDRQLWNPPWVEMVVLHFQVLMDSDRLANLVQWFSMLGCMVGAALITRRLGANRLSQFMAALFSATIPMGVMQATSVKNDYATGFWVVCLAAFSVLAHQRRLRSWEWLLVSLVVGLGVLTKGTFYAYAIPFLGWLLLSALRHSGWKHAFSYAFLGLAVLVVLNAGVWVRNFGTYDTPLGPNESLSALTSLKPEPAAYLSNLLLNTSLHLAVPVYSPANRQIEDFIERVSQWMGVNPPEQFEILSMWRFEDYAGNPLHFFLGLTAAAVLLLSFSRAGNGTARIYAGAVLATFLVYALLFEWQPFGSRLQLPFFILLSPVFGFITGSYSRAWIPAGAAALLLVSGALSLVFNSARPIVSWGEGSVSIFEQTREEMLFANSRWAQSGYMAVSEAINASGCRQVALIIDSHDPEYPLWALLSPRAGQKKLQHIDSVASFEIEPGEGDQPCALFCTYCSTERTMQYGLDLVADYEGSKFFAPAGN